MLYDEDDLKDYRLVAPDVDALLRCFDRRYMNPTSSTPALLETVRPLFEALLPLEPLKDIDEVKAIWLRIPRGTIEDYGSFEDMREWGEVETREEYEALWLDRYPEGLLWYRLVAVKSFNKDGSLRYCGISLGNKTIVSMLCEGRSYDVKAGRYEVMTACRLCSLILPAVQESIGLLVDGTYNQMVADLLPYQFRTGVIRRSDLWKAEPSAKNVAYDGLSEETVCQFRTLVRSGANDVDNIGRIKEFTANDFFRACRIGYEAIGWECDGLSPSELYLRYADGRDEGLTGEGHGLNAGPGISFDDPKAWDEWYFDRTQHGGHPWEVVRGGNSTHVELYVRNDRRSLELALRLGEIGEAEYEERMDGAGYYFAIAGAQRQFEAVSFYVALSAAGYPVVIGQAEELLARFEASDWIGIVPHHVFTRYCGDLFPEEYGDILDFAHVYKGEDAWFDSVVWLPVEEASVVGGHWN